MSHLRSRNAPFLLICLALAQSCASARAGEGALVIYPREYWDWAEKDRNPLVLDSKAGEPMAVGRGARLVEIENEEGEEIQVIEYLPSRTAQREADIHLFHTNAKPVKPPLLLKKTYKAFNGAEFVDQVFEESARVDRTIYRAGSYALAGKIGSLYEMALLNARLATLYRFAAGAHALELIGQRDLPPAAWAMRSHDSLQEFIRDLEKREIFYRAALTNLKRVPEHLAAAEKLLPQIKEKRKAQAEAALKLEKLDEQVGGRIHPKGDPLIRERDYLYFDEYEMRADIRFLERQVEEHQGLVKGVLTAVYFDINPPPEDAEEPPDLSNPLGLAAEYEKYVAEQIAKVVEARKKFRTVRQVIAAGLPAIEQLVKSLPDKLPAEEKVPDAQKAELQKRKEQFDQLLASYETAYLENDAQTEIEAALEAQEKAAAKLPTLPAGRYRVTVFMRIEGVPNCLGTPIRVTAAEVERDLFQYQWADTETFHPVSFEMELREGKLFTLDTTLPSPGGLAWGIIFSPDDYNAVRMAGWEVKERDTLGQLADTLFSPPDPKARTPDSPWKRIEQFLHDRDGVNGTFPIGIALTKTRRRGRGMGGPDATIDAVYLDWVKIERVPEPKLVLRQVLAQKVWLRPGESNNFIGWIHNRTKQRQQGRVKLYWTSNISDEKLIGERDVTLEPHSFKTIAMPWQSPKDVPLWGHEVRMELACGDEKSVATDVFSIHTNTFASMSHGGAVTPNVYFGSKNYRNHLDFFGCSQGDSVCLLPEDLRVPYMGGMMRTDNHLMHHRATVQRNRKLGIGCVQYLSPLCTSHMAYKYYLTNPEWFPGRLLWTELMNNNWLEYVGELHKAYRAGERSRWDWESKGLLHLEQPVNFAHDSIFDNLVEDVITYHNIVGFEGIRWDGGPLPVFPKDFLGQVCRHPKTGKPLSDEMDRRQLSADRFAEFKRRVKVTRPNFVYGNNGDAYGYGNAVRNLDPEIPDVKDYPHFREFMKDDASYMDETWMSAYIFTDNRNKADHYIRIMRKQCDVMKKNGGYLQTFSPARQGWSFFNIDLIYYNVLCPLCGSHYPGELSASPWSEDGPIHFVTRFCGYLYDKRLHKLEDAEDKIDVDLPGVWFHEVATQRVLSKDHVQIVVPIINKHPRERLYDNQSRYSELPEVVDEPFEVTVQAPDGFDGAALEAWELACEPRTTATKLQADFDGGEAAFEVNGLKFFKVIVLDFKKAAP